MRAIRKEKRRHFSKSHIVKTQLNPNKIETCELPIRHLKSKRKKKRKRKKEERKKKKKGGGGGRGGGGSRKKKEKRMQTGMGQVLNGSGGGLSTASMPADRTQANQEVGNVTKPIPSSL